MRMRRAIPLALVISVAVPTGAAAKGGVTFDRYPDVQAVGSPMSFTTTVMHGDNTMRATVGVRPLVTFRDAKTGAVVRVRASRSDRDGISRGTVALPSKGPWDTRISVAGHGAGPEDAEPFRVGVGLTQTIPAADARPATNASPARHGAGTAIPWLWIFSGASIAAAALVAVARRRGHWGAA